MNHLVELEPSSLNIFNKMQLFDIHTGQTTHVRCHVHQHLRPRRWGRNVPLVGGPGGNLCVV